LGKRLERRYEPPENGVTRGENHISANGRLEILVGRGRTGLRDPFSLNNGTRDSFQSRKRSIEVSRPKILTEPAGFTSEKEDSEGGKKTSSENPFET